MFNYHNDGDHMIHMRKAGPQDVTLLCSLIRDSHRDVAERFGLTQENCPRHPSNCTQEWIEKDLLKGVDYYILEHDDTPAGCVAIEQASPEVCYLERLSVLPEQRRNGLGRALVTNVLLKAKTIGVGEVGIGIIAQYSELKAWYTKIGFVEGETREFAHLPFSVTFMSYKF
jgi:GNAT superfamily N-acetyltransferase